MKDYISERVIMLAQYIIENKATVRAAAKEYGISKSTVHKDVAERLYNIDRKKYEAIVPILAQNKAERHIRGGLATKRKYERLNRK